MTGVQTCALPIYGMMAGFKKFNQPATKQNIKIGGETFRNVDAGAIDTITQGMEGTKNLVQKGGLMKFNTGGYLPYGNRLNDTIPALLSGGEYVVNSRAVRKYGVGGLNRINSGIARFQDGGAVDGEVSVSPSNSSNTSNNNVSINITVNATGGGKTDESQEDRKSTRLNSSHIPLSRMPSSA